MCRAPGFFNPGAGDTGNPGEKTCVEVPVTHGTMRNLVLCFSALALLLPGSLSAQQGGPQRAKAYATAPDISYDSVPNFIKLPPGLYLGEGIGVARNSKGHVFVYTRSGESSRLFEFDETGKFVREIGRGVYGFQMAHAVRVDPQDNIWVVDEGTDTVMKFNPAGRIEMVLGRRPEAEQGLIATPPRGTPPPPAGRYTFGRPTDIAWDAAGNIFIADGYNNSRVVKYDKNGRFIRSVGTRGTAPSQMNTPHSIQVDAGGNVYVADRGNRRIQVFSNDLVLRAIYDNVGAPWALCITPGPHQYLYSSNSNPDNNNATISAVTGEIYKMELDGTVLGKFGVPGKQLGQFGTVHAIDCKVDNELIVGEITSWRVQKLMLKPTATQSSTR
jgi:DNA-binding beta-propeller fold protein YncE